MRQILIKVWRDTVWSKVIAAFIIWIITYSISQFSLVKSKILLLFNGDLTQFQSVLFFSLIISSILFLVFLLVKFLDKKRLQKKYHRVFQSQSGDILDIDDILRKAPKITKISVVGISQVGKTTLIENLCRIDNENLLTQGRNGYITNFSNKEYKYAALFDGSGQSQATQNDLALKADILLVMIDNNESSFKARVNKERLQRHSQFFGLLIDRFSTSSLSPNHVFILMNKNDLWGNSTNRESILNEFVNKQEKIFKEGFRHSSIQVRVFSNERREHLNWLRTEIKKLIN